MPARKKRPGKCGTPTYGPPDDITPEERLLLAIVGRDDGKTYEETVARMRRERTKPLTAACSHCGGKVPHDGASWRESSACAKEENSG